MKQLLVTLSIISACTPFGFSQTNSVAREWNNIILEAIRNDFARPTVHARNLYHHSIIAYDAWAAFDPSKKTFFLGDTLHGYICPFDGIDYPADIQAAREEAIAYASYRFIYNRYLNSPDYAQTFLLTTNYMEAQGFDTSITSTDYVNDGPAALGNYLAEQIQLYGYTDGSNEQNDFANIYYDQLNPPIDMSLPGNPSIQDPNHWQPITLTTSIDQSGNPVSSTPPHLGPEWGEVDPFSLDTSMYTELTRDGDTYKVYFDTVMPAFLDPTDSSDWGSFYKWNHTLVSIWQSHNDPTDGVMWDISPASKGNNTWYPADSTQYAAFYDLTNGGDPGTGYALNPVTGLPYTPQIVPRGDYTRVLAEFWADGIDSETPPGHWFEIYHYVTDQPTFEYKWQGVGPVLDKLEYDVKAQLTLGGTVHDAAICAWSLKGYYDYLRPVSAIRYMADLGQSSDTTELSYHPSGIPLMPGFVEVVQIGDPLAGQWNEHVGKIKLYTWRGHAYINDPLVDMAGVGWILAENWWPYQRPTFVTPPFAGFVSGHSTFSRAAANIMEFITGSPYFPGGLGEFPALQNDFLQFEEGPSTTITLQWASYKDAADQCSLSRIWGGIHPPIDDIPGRMIGEQVGQIAFNKADSIFDQQCPAIVNATITDTIINIADIGSQFDLQLTFNVSMDTSIAPVVSLLTAGLSTVVTIAQVNWIDSTNLTVTFDVPVSSDEFYETRVQLSNMTTGTGLVLDDVVFHNFFVVDTRRPLLSTTIINSSVLNDPMDGLLFTCKLVFDEPCDTSITPAINFSSPSLVNPTLTFDAASSEWLNDTIYKGSFLFADYDELITDISTDVSLATDLYGNDMTTDVIPGLFIVDTENPMIAAAVSTDTLLTQSDLITPQFYVTIDFSEAMDTSSIPALSFEDQGNSYTTILQSPGQTSWLDTNTIYAEFFLTSNTNDLIPLDLNVSGATDDHSNPLNLQLSDTLVWSDLKSPEITNISASTAIISDSVVGNGLYYVDITFSEAMDISVVPLVNHSAAQSIVNSVQYNVPMSTYLDSTNYRAYYQILDENIEVVPVYLTVDFGQDASGNDQVVYSDSSFTGLDTKNPEVIALLANDYTLDQLGQPFDVIVMYNEDMFTDKHPEIAYSPVIVAPVDLPKVDSMWNNSTTYTFNFELTGGPTVSTLYDVNVLSAVDLAGNLQLEHGINEFVQIDPALGIATLEEQNALLYPTILTSGQHLNLIGNDLHASDLSFELINSLGQRIKSIEFTLNNNHYETESLSLDPGIYYLSNNSHLYKILVL